jgi:ribosomal protein S27AE
MKTTSLCPRCGSITPCYTKDVGGVDYSDEYTRHCPNCGNITRGTKNGGSPLGENELTECPFCGRGTYAHEETPAELWGYIHRYLPLHSFDFGGWKMSIIVKDDHIVLKNETDDIPCIEIQLNLPVPRKYSKIHTTWEHYDEIALTFENTHTENNIATIEVTISEQIGYWYYGSTDDEVPGVEISYKKITLIKKGPTLEIKIS